MELESWIIESKEKVLLENCAKVITDYAEYCHSEHAMSINNSAYKWNPILNDNDTINLAINLYKKGYINELIFCGKELIIVGEWDGHWSVELSTVEKKMIREEVVLIASSIGSKVI